MVLLKSVRKTPTLNISWFQIYKSPSSNDSYGQWAPEMMQAISILVSHLPLSVHSQQQVQPAASHGAV